MTKPKKQHMWLDRYPITDPKHVHTLETAAAVHEFLTRLPRHEAEARAHDEYKKDQILESAAHHLSGMKAAHASGSLEESKKHGVMYGLALQQLGHDPLGPVPPEVSHKLKNLEVTAPIYKFKAHRGDSFTVPEEPKATEGDVKKSEDLAKAGALPPPVPLGRSTIPLQQRQIGGTPHFNYDDHLPEHSKAGGFNKLTVSQHGQTIHANLGQHGAVVLHPSATGDFSVIHDQIKNHPKASVRMQHPHMMAALKTHLAASTQSKPFVALHPSPSPATFQARPQ